MADEGSVATEAPSTRNASKALAPSEKLEDQRRRNINTCSNCGWPFNWAGSSTTVLTSGLRRLEDSLVSAAAANHNDVGLYGNAQGAHLLHSHMKNYWPTHAHAYAYPAYPATCRAAACSFELCKNTKVLKDTNTNESDKDWLKASRRSRNFFDMTHLEWDVQISKWIKALLTSWINKGIDAAAERIRKLGIHAEEASLQDPTPLNLRPIADQFKMLYGGVIVQCAVVMLNDSRNRHAVFKGEHENFVLGIDNMLKLSCDISTQVVIALRTGFHLHQNQPDRSLAETHAESLTQWKEALNPVQHRFKPKHWEDTVFAACHRCNAQHTVESKSHHNAYSLFGIADTAVTPDARTKWQVPKAEESIATGCHEAARRLSQGIRDRMTNLSTANLGDQTLSIVADAKAQYKFWSEPITAPAPGPPIEADVFKSLSSEFINGALASTYVELQTLNTTLFDLHDDIFFCSMSTARTDLANLLARLAIIHNAFMNLLQRDDLNLLCCQSITELESITELNASTSQYKVGDLDYTITNVLTPLQQQIDYAAQRLFPYVESWNDDAWDLFHTSVHKQICEAHTTAYTMLGCTPLEAATRFVSHAVRVSVILQLNLQFATGTNYDKNMMKRVESRNKHLLNVSKVTASLHHVENTLPLTDTSNPDNHLTLTLTQWKIQEKARLEQTQQIPDLHFFKFAHRHDKKSSSTRVGEDWSLYEHCFTPGGLHEYIEAITRVNLQSAACLVAAGHLDSQHHISSKSWPRNLSYILPTAAALWATASMWFSLQLVQIMQCSADSVVSPYVEYFEVLWRFVVVETAPLQVLNRKKSTVVNKGTNLVAALQFKWIQDNLVMGNRQNSINATEKAAEAVIKTVQYLTKALYTYFDDNDPHKADEIQKKAPALFMIAVLAAFQFDEDDTQTNTNLMAAQNLLVAVFHSTNIRSTKVGKWVKRIEDKVGQDSEHDSNALASMQKGGKQKQAMKQAVDKEAVSFCADDRRLQLNRDAACNVLLQWSQLRLCLPTKSQLIALLRDLAGGDPQVPLSPVYVVGLLQKKADARHAVQIMLRLAQLLCVDTDSAHMDTQVALQLRKLLHDANPLATVAY